MTTEKHDHANDTTPVTVIGLGLMGQALAGAFLRGGHPTTVWNRTAAKADALVAEGATLAGSVGDAVAASPLVVVCVTDYDAVHGLLDPVGDALAGRTLVNLTSGTSEGARQTAEWAARQGATYLDGGIMAVPQGIGTADAALVYSGPRAAFDRYEPVLANLGATSTHLGEDHALSALHEMAVVGLMWSIMNGFLQGAAMLSAAGVSASAYAPIATLATTTVNEWLPGYARQIDDDAYPPLDATLDTHLAAMEHMVREAEALGVNTELPAFIKDLAERGVAGGHGGNGYPALIEQFRKPRTT
ncbi:NAD(P)-binding domain-containing protein [Spirillospora sp. NPDC047279]|uniref:NAD(P)-dependent oxidoreductase n=1 Tax=Spirillospora sp. NPDC047279 TaxID=3155478 RepID=UPI0033CCF2C7